MHRILTITVASVSFALAACDKSAPPTTTAPAPATSVSDRVEHDLKAAGHQAKQEVQTLGQNAEPAIQKAKQETKTAIHQGAQKIADLTAPQTVPATAASQP